MLTILTAYVCLHGVCTQVTIPTPASLDEKSCEEHGYLIALKHVSPHWRVVAFECEEGRFV